jgi:hypothetical protein
MKTESTITSWNSGKWLFYPFLCFFGGFYKPTLFSHLPTGLHHEATTSPPLTAIPLGTTATAAQCATSSRYAGAADRRQGPPQCQSASMYPAEFKSWPGDNRGFLWPYVRQEYVRLCKQQNGSMKLTMQFVGCCIGYVMRWILSIYDFLHFDLSSSDAIWSTAYHVLSQSHILSQSLWSILFSHMFLPNPIVFPLLLQRIFISDWTVTSKLCSILIYPLVI